MGTHTILAAFGFGPMELGIIAVIALLLFGKRLPEVMRSMGKGVVEFKRGLKDVEREVDDESKTIEPPPPPPPPPPADR